MRSFILTAAVALHVVFAPPTRAQELEPPRLVVVISVDSLSPMQIARVDDLFIGGFARLLSEGARFERCYHEHGVTMTGPGHFVLMSGRYPGPAGMIANSWWDPTTRAWTYCIGDSLSRLTGYPDSHGEWSLNDPHHEFRSGSSYRNVNASAVGDWLKLENGRSKVFSISRKDRSAVLLGGRSADGVYWYDSKTGAFVTSSFYLDTPHEWVQRYNKRRRADDFRNERWERLLADTAIYEERARADSFPGEYDFSSLGLDAPDGAPTFDHWVTSGQRVEDAEYYSALYKFPFLDVMTMELVHEAITAEALGADDDPDVLCIGLSVLDNASHTSGPLSQEALDVVLRVDRLLGELFDRLDREIGSRYVVALCSDHGMPPIPEYLDAGHRDEIGGGRGRRSGPDATRFRQRLDAATADMCGGTSAVAAVIRQGIYIDWPLVRDLGVSIDAVDAVVRDLASTEPWIQRVLSRRELLASADIEDPVERRYRNSTHPSASPDYFLCPLPGTLYEYKGSNHGTPHDYDAHVPLLLWGAGIVTGAHDTIVETVDIAPTLAHLLRLKDVPAVDGRVLIEAIHPAFER